MLVLNVFVFIRKLQRLWLVGNRTSCCPILSVVNKSDSRVAVARFCLSLDDYGPNWTPLAPITIIYRLYQIDLINVSNRLHFLSNWLVLKGPVPKQILEINLHTRSKNLFCMHICQLNFFRFCIDLIKFVVSLWV